MAKSIMQTEKECFVCRELMHINCTIDLEEHHIYMGNPKRQLSEQYGLKVHLCKRHHTGNEGVHHNRPLDLWLKKGGQTKFEQIHSRELFMQLFGRNYID